MMNHKPSMTFRINTIAEKRSSGEIRLHSIIIVWLMIITYHFIRTRKYIHHFKKKLKNLKVLINLSILERWVIKSATLELLFWSYCRMYYNYFRCMIQGNVSNIVLRHDERHDGTVGSAPGFGSRLPRSRPGRDNCVEALSPHRVTAVGKLLTLNCLGGDWPSYTFILTIVSDCVCVNLH